ncbi:DUF2793 domain-containing protein [Mesorhizobium sp. M2D.F.Ca.ET.232.01.1.1]|uniref:DUF2793 domain-containing protein n=1 Tax=Mesorhizobium sp. M2D.F.Ca.ET.232.01.1.1 TaxID=2496670 RepID=UPI000FCC3FA9|nr:DUF2793 domain-containing protein [Mesorhizobium sp. M2D.F.Ca.ET.232.01.1.1]TGP28194.1 DUF2793 domain-containing protein [Mesorhizobium sp. M2D.F.Ca.ET.232.01.1.1]
MTVSNRLGITELAASQVDRSVTVNEAIAKLEAGATFFAAIQVSLNAPPGSPAEGDLYVVGTAGTGAWSGHDKNVALYYNAAWLFFVPFEGMFAWDQTSDSLKRYDGSAWVAFTVGAGGISDADYGDIVVSSSGTVWTIDNDAVSNAKAANMAQSTIKGRAAGAGTGDPTDLSVAQVVAIIGDPDGTLAANSDSLFATQKATKTYVDGKVAGLSWKQAVRAATTANGTLASAFANGSTIDGVTLATGDRILIKNQSSGAENGIYIVAASGAPARATDADSGAELVNASVYVSEGTTQADTQWTCTTNAPITVGSTSLSFAQFVSSSLSAASTTEVLTGTDTSKYATADSIAALWEKGSDVASASTVSLGEGGFFHITGTTTITDIDWATAKDGRPAYVIFDGALTLTHNATTLKLPGGANITTAAGDRAIFVQDNGDNVICIAYIRADGKPIVASVTGTPFEMEVACSDESTALTSGTSKVTFRMPRAVTLSEVRASLATAQTSGSIFTVDINEVGTTILSTKLTIDNTEKTSTTAATPPVISDVNLADDAEMTVDIDQVGDGTAKGLKIVLIGTRA